jgi:aspartate kinase
VDERIPISEPLPWAVDRPWDGDTGSAATISPSALDQGEPPKHPDQVRRLSDRNIIVQKFGGSSVADTSGIKRAAQRIADTVASGAGVVAVVSAMGDTTDELCDLAAELSPRPWPRHLDALLSTGELISSALLAIALEELGVAASTFTGSEAGLVTDSLHGKAHIIAVNPNHIRACLERNETAIVAGIQGSTRGMKITTTLGRGGSDLTAVALAAALGARMCEIYTDVDGVYTADPRVVPTARKIFVLSSEEMLEFAASGSKVLHLRSVEYARRFAVPIHVRSSFVKRQGTLILPDVPRNSYRETVDERAVIASVADEPPGAQITVFGIPNESGKVAALLQGLTASGVTVEAIVQNIPTFDSGRSDISFTVPAQEVSEAVEAVGAARGAAGFRDFHLDDEVGRVRLVGLGLRTSPHVLSTFYQALSNAGIRIKLIETSDTCILAVTEAREVKDAVIALRAAYGLAGLVPQREGELVGTRGPSDAHPGSFE